MSKDLINAPVTRSWRDISQPVKPRAMSREGRWRLLAATFRTTAAVAVAGALAWGGWAVAGALGENSKSMPAAARAVPLKRAELKTNREGVLDRDPEWLTRTLALPKSISLMEIDLLQLRTRLLADGQVLTANISRSFPDRLNVQVTERTPIARVMAGLAGEARPLLVARDGVVFPGAGYDPKLIESLPWLAGVALTRRNQQFLPLAGMETIGELLGEARQKAEHLYHTWHVVSLERLASDRQIEVRTRAPHAVTIVFSATDDFFRQLAKLDYMWQSLATRPAVQARIDLTLGRHVPVTLTEPPVGGLQAGPTAKPAAAAFPAFPARFFQPKREL